MWFTVLRNANFRRLWTASTIDSCGSWILVMAVPLQAFVLTGSAMSTGLALAIEALPVVLVAPWAGMAIDRWQRKKVLVVANVAGAAGVTLMMFAARPDRLGFIYLGLLVESLAVCFLRPAIAAVTPAIVGSDSDLASANALSAFTNSAFRMLGPLVGTFMVAAGWFQAVILVDVASYLAAAAIIMGVAIIPTARPARMAPRITGELREGLRHILRTPLLRGLLSTSWVGWTANAGLTVLLIPFVANRLHSSGQTVGYLVAGLGVGYLCGSAVSKILISRYATRTILVAAQTAVGVCFVVGFSATEMPIALVAIAASGVPGAIGQVVAGHRLQTSTPDGLLGRVSAAFYSSDALAAVTGALIAPAVVAVTGLAAALIALSVAVLATAAMAVVVLPAAGIGDHEFKATVPAGPTVP
jgi:predicted MFS family arabinose efflux permease